MTKKKVVVLLDVYKSNELDLEGCIYIKLSTFAGITSVKRGGLNPNTYPEIESGINSIYELLRRKKPAKIVVAAWCPLYFQFLFGRQLELLSNSLVYCNYARSGGSFTENQFYPFVSPNSEKDTGFHIIENLIDDNGSTVTISFFMDEKMIGLTKKLVQTCNDEGLPVSYSFSIYPLVIDDLKVNASTFASFHNDVKNIVSELITRLKEKTYHDIAISIYGPGFLAMLIGTLLPPHISTNIRFYDFNSKTQTYECSSGSLDVFKFLHLSDFHVDEDNEGKVKVRLNNLSLSMKSMKIELDAIFITGDLVRIPEEDNFNIFKDILLNFVKKIWGTKENLANKKIFIVPGNHDIKRDIASFEESVNPDKVDNNEHEKRTREFCRLMTDLKQVFNESLFFTDESELNSFQSGNLKVDVVMINTAYIYSKKNTERMKAHPKTMEDTPWGLLTDKDPCKSLRIVLGHHPLSWLTGEQRKPDGLVENVINKSHFYCHGHTHQGSIVYYGGHTQLLTGAVHHAEENVLTLYEYTIISVESGRRGCSWKPTIIYRLNGSSPSVTDDVASRALKISVQD